MPFYLLCTPYNANNFNENDFDGEMFIVHRNDSSNVYFIGLCPCFVHHHFGYGIHRMSIVYIIRENVNIALNSFSAAFSQLFFGNVLV